MKNPTADKVDIKSKFFELWPILLWCLLAKNKIITIATKAKIKCVLSIIFEEKIKTSVKNSIFFNSYLLNPHL